MSLIILIIMAILLVALLIVSLSMLVNDGEVLPIIFVLIIILLYVTMIIEG